MYGPRPCDILVWKEQLGRGLVGVDVIQNDVEVAAHLEDPALGVPEPVGVLRSDPGDVPS